jgi:glucokinase
VEILFEAAKAGDAAALRVVDELGKVNAVGFANVVNAFDPELITIGGSIALNNPELILAPIMENIDRHLLNRRPRIMITPLGDDVVLYGALARALSLI